MKKIIALALALIMSIGCLTALAEDEEIAAFKESLNWADPVVQDSAEVDLNGDGSNETVELWVHAGTDEYDNEYDYLTVSIAGTEVKYEPEDYCYSSNMFAVDMDGDGSAEIFLTMTTENDYSFTTALRFTGDELEQILAPDLGVDETVYFPTISGYVTGCSDNKLRVVSSVYVLGTYAMERTLTLKDGRFEVADDGMYIAADTGDDRWSYQAIAPLNDLEVEFTDGAGTLKAGEKILVTATDNHSKVEFITEDGREGTLTIAFDENAGYGFTVNGVNEYEVFGNLPYAG